MPTGSQPSSFETLPSDLTVTSSSVRPPEPSTWAR